MAQRIVLENFVSSIRTLAAGVLVDDAEPDFPKLVAAGLVSFPYSAQMDAFVTAWRNQRVANLDSVSGLGVVLLAAGFFGDGAGDVVGPGPGTVTAKSLARFVGTTGKLIGEAQTTLEDDGSLVLPVGATVDGRDVSADGAVLDALVGTVGGLSSDVATLQGDVGALQGDVGTLQADVSTLSGQVTALGVEVDERELLPERLVFTTVGDNPWTAPADADVVMDIVMCPGSGGGGGGGAGGGSSAGVAGGSGGGRGGGGGGPALATVARGVKLVPSGSYNFHVGAKGVGGAGAVFGGAAAQDGTNGEVSYVELAGNKVVTVGTVSLGTVVGSVRGVGGGNGVSATGAAGGAGGNTGGTGGVGGGAGAGQSSQGPNGGAGGAANVAGANGATGAIAPGSGLYVDLAYSASPGTPGNGGAAQLTHGGGGGGGGGGASGRGSEYNPYEAQALSSGGSGGTGGNGGAGSAGAANPGTDGGPGQNGVGGRGGGGGGAGGGSGSGTTAGTGGNGGLGGDGTNGWIVVLFRRVLP